jgi:hypothetical protein
MAFFGRNVKLNQEEGKRGSFCSFIAILDIDNLRQMLRGFGIWTTNIVIC